MPCRDSNQYLKPVLNGQIPARAVDFSAIIPDPTHQLITRDQLPRGIANLRLSYQQRMFNEESLFDHLTMILHSDVFRKLNQG